VLLTMPAQSSLRSAREFAERNAAWIGARLARLPRPVAFVAAAVTPLRGVDHTIVHRPNARGVVWTERGPHGPLICVAGEKPFVARRVADFLKREARKDLEAAVARYSQRLGVADHAARHIEPLGLMLVNRRAQFLVAADPRAARDPRLSGRARSRPHPAHEPLADVLESDAPAPSRNRSGRGVAARPRRGFTPLRRRGRLRPLSRNCRPLRAAARDPAGATDGDRHP
jgi:hypothetical protein